MNIYEIIIILIGHWVGDFCLQTEEMGTRKSSDNMWLTAHVAIYTLSLFLVFLVFTFFLNSLVGIIVWVLINAILHWITDYYTSRWAKKLWAEKNYYGFPSFFSVIGLDQVIHYVCLFVTWRLMQ